MELLANVAEYVAKHTGVLPLSSLNQNQQQPPPQCAVSLESLQRTAAASAPMLRRLMLSLTSELAELEAVEAASSATQVPARYSLFDFFIHIISLSRRSSASTNNFTETW